MTTIQPTEVRSEQRGRWAVLALGLAVYIVACAAPALTFEKVDRANQSPQVMKGFEAALLGWQALFVGNFGWIANPLLFLSLLFILLRSWRMAVGCAVLGLLCAVHSLTLLGQRIIADEGGVTHMVLRGLHSGFYLWLLSILIAAGGSFWLWRGGRRLVTALPY